MKALEITGIVDEKGCLSIKEKFPFPNIGEVKVIVLWPEDDDIEEAVWLKSAAMNPVFDFLKDSAEDIYSLSDGKQI